MFSLTLRNYWWPLIWLFLGNFVLSRLPRRRERLRGRIVERWDLMPALVMVLPYIVWSGFRGGIGDSLLSS